MTQSLSLSLSPHCLYSLLPFSSVSSSPLSLSRVYRLSRKTNHFSYITPLRAPFEFCRYYRFLPCFDTAFSATPQRMLLRGFLRWGRLPHPFYSGAGPIMPAVSSSLPFPHHMPAFLPLPYHTPTARALPLPHFPPHSWRHCSILAAFLLLNLLV